MSQQQNQPNPPLASPVNPLPAVQPGLRSLQQQVPGGQEGGVMRLDSARAPASIHWDSLRGY